MGVVVVVVVVVGALEVVVVVVGPLGVVVVVVEELLVVVVGEVLLHPAITLPEVIPNHTRSIVSWTGTVWPTPAAE